MANKLVKITREFFEQNPVVVAKSLLGRELVRTFDSGTEARGTILEVSAWQGTNGDQEHKYTDFEPGQLSVSRKFGKNLADITTGRYGNGCVTLIAALYDFAGTERIAQGPGNLTKALQIDQSLDGYRMASRRDVLRVLGNPIDPAKIKQRNKSNVPANCRGYFYVPRKALKE